MLKSCIKNWKRIDDDMAADVAQRERSKIKCYASVFSNILIGKSFGYRNLITHLGGIWKPKGNFSMIHLGYDFFLVKFSTLEDYQKALEQGQWFVGENYLLVRKWEPEFQAAKAKVSSMAVWIRLAKLPIEFFHPDILRVVGNTIGTVGEDFDPSPQAVCPLWGRRTHTVCSSGILFPSTKAYKA